MRDWAHEPKPQKESFWADLDLSQEAFERTRDLADKSGLTEPCTHSGHKHKPGAHTTISGQGMQILYFLAQFVDSETVVELARINEFADMQARSDSN